MRTRVSLFVPFLFAILSVGAATAQQTQPLAPEKQTAGEGDQATPSNTTASLQKATQNPVANLISVPLQNNSNFGIGPYDRTQNVLNIQPVIPVGISKD